MTIYELLLWLIYKQVQTFAFVQHFETRTNLWSFPFHVLFLFFKFTRSLLSFCLLPSWWHQIFRTSWKYSLQSHETNARVVRTEKDIFSWGLGGLSSEGFITLALPEKVELLDFQRNLIDTNQTNIGVNWHAQCP